MIMCLLFLVVVLDLEEKEGTIITYTDSIEGHIKVDLEQNTVVLREGNSYKHYYARDIKKVVLQSEGSIIQYASYPFGVNEDHFLFEELSTGQVPLLFRRGLKFSKYDETTFPPFFMAIEGSVYSIEGKKQVLEVMKDQKDAIKDYVKENKVDFDERQSLTDLFEFYNAL